MQEISTVHVKRKLESAHPKKHVLSFRVSEAEWQRLQSVALAGGGDVSSLLRQSLKLLLKDHQG